LTVLFFLAGNVHAANWIKTGLGSLVYIGGGAMLTTDMEGASDENKTYWYGAGLGLLIGGFIVILAGLIEEDASIAQIQNDPVLSRVAVGFRQEGLFMGVKLTP
jgi:hypothetical protein